MPLWVVLSLAFVAAGAAGAALGLALDVSMRSGFLFGALSAVPAVAVLYALAGYPARRQVGRIVALLNARSKGMGARSDGAQVARRTGRPASSGGSLAKETARPTRDVVDQVQGVLEDHARLVAHMVQIGSGMATAAAEVSFASDQLRKRVGAQVEHAVEIESATQSISGTVEDAAASSSRSAEVAELARRASHAGQDAIEAARHKMDNVQTRVEDVAHSVERLESRAEEIRKITGVIEEIADQTNLLALNASIEAARSGEHGRGFAVVADEVRNLAARTATATTEIGRMVQDIDNEAAGARRTMEELDRAVRESTEQTVAVDRQFAEVLSRTGEVEEQILQVAEGGRRTHDQLAQITGSVHNVTQQLSETATEVDSVSKQALELSERAETIFEELGGESMGDVHDQVRRLASNAAAEIGAIFERAVSQNRISLADLFARNYEPIEGTRPTKYRTRFDRLTDELLPAVQEPILAQCPAVIFAATVDDHGYLPTHNRKFAQPLTGDYERDLTNSRTKRIFDDRTGSRCGAHTKAFLLQTYKRDTGEVMHDLSVPIFVQGRHWGGFRIGYKAA
ncbi:MAG: methyl-accepting chemotaxis protein [Candidatus Eisenbacteria bacterium]